MPHGYTASDHDIADTIFPARMHYNVGLYMAYSFHVTQLSIYTMTPKTTVNE